MLELERFTTYPLGSGLAQLDVCTQNIGSRYGRVGRQSRGAFGVDFERGIPRKLEATEYARDSLLGVERQDCQVVTCLVVHSGRQLDLNVLLDGSSWAERPC